MEYSNPKIPEHINTSREHPLKEFFLLSGAVLVTVIVLVAALSLITEKLATYVPFSMEQKLADKFLEPVAAQTGTSLYLQTLVDELVPHLELAPDTRITLHYVDDDVENAFATIGGHIFIHRGLLELMPHENALAMVVAHEIAHVKNRHPLIATGRGLVLVMLLATVTGLGGDAMAGKIVGNISSLTALSFSREQESRADLAALRALQAHYGHVSGASDLFRVLMEKKQGAARVPAKFFSTHPLGPDRIRAIEDYARENGWPDDRITQPLKSPLQNLPQLPASAVSRA